MQWFEKTFVLQNFNKALIVSFSEDDRTI